MTRKINFLAAYFRLAVVAMTGSTLHAQTPPLAFQSATNQTALVELYTSEGCSSCPPAEDWLSGLKQSPALWKDFVPVAWHVDYWDQLGWRDPWSAAQFTERQRRQAEGWGSGTIYTPGVVLNGKEWPDWRGARNIPQGPAAAPGVLTVNAFSTNEWRVSFNPVNPGETGYEAHAALLGCGLSSNVKAGENRGRKLRHDFVALKLADAVLARQENLHRGGFTLAAPPETADQRLALAVWVTRSKQMEPVQAVGGWISRGPGR
jgi:hypothetical protein